MLPALRGSRPSVTFPNHSWSIPLTPCSRALRLACLPYSNELQDAELGDPHGCSYLMVITRRVPVVPLASLFAQRWNLASL